MIFASTILKKFDSMQNAAPIQPYNLGSQMQWVVTDDLASNRDRIMRLYADRTRLTNFCAVLNCILQPTGNS